MGIAELVLTSASALIKAIDMWGKFRDRRRAREAYETELQTPQASEQVKIEAEQLEGVVPEGVLTSLNERIRECWANFENALADEKGLAQEEVDLAMHSAIRCWCKEVNRIRTLTGTLPTTLAAPWEQYNCATKIEAGI